MDCQLGFEVSLTAYREAVQSNDPYDLALEKGWISLSTVYVTPQSVVGTFDSVIVYKISFVDGTPLEFTEGYNQEAPIVGRLETYGILTTIEDVIAFLDISIQRYSTVDGKSWWTSAENLYDWNWLNQIVNDLGATLFNAINIINRTDLPLEQGIPQIDSCLKQLAAYMVLQGWKVPTINRLSISQ